MCCTETITRILVFVTNLAFLLVGVALLTVGILYTIHFTHYTQAIPDDYQTIQYVPTIAIAVGSIIVIIAFLGCCGTLRSSTCMLTTYAAILFVIFLIQVGLGVYGLLQIKNRDEFESKLDSQITKLFKQYKENSEITGVVDLIQQNLQCCGTYSPLFWIMSGFLTPSSCYKNNVLFTEGCSSAMYNLITTSITIIAIIALAVSATEIIGAILALCLTNCIRASSRQRGYY